jgi:hypothetical protein
MNTFQGLALATTLLLDASEAHAVNPNPGIVPPDHSFHGMTYAEWSGQLLQWGIGIPKDIHPLLDTTGEFADVHQSGAVWFLVISSGETLTRTVTVPSDKFLFVPIISTFWFPTGHGSQDLTLMRQRFAVESEIDSFLSVGTFWCEIDGVAVSNLESYRVSTAPGEAYFVRVPEESLFAVPAGYYGPTVNAGIYLLLRPLSAGEHTIQIFASDNATFTNDVTYNLTVEE